ncbi:MFS transporter [Plantactinospora sp. S1510]|uniref:MFS transporter n=1 Tax=Plantactinospora alkalitolerans TaxID=2789879 RepID=A0ABS0GVE3_9ACTN|nr:MFS transporter [Plantactinospora alkalitolerans]MBF9129867.1 MFS transporter [Plantactinospora alkalitolerans]
MHTYRDLFRVPEFGPLFAAVSLQTAARTVMGLALGTLVYAATGSPLLAALSLFGSYFAQVLGAATLLSVADRVPPRAAMVALAAFGGLSTLALALPGMPVWGIFCVIGLQGLVGSVAGGVRWGLLGEILPGSGYVLGRSVFNMSLGVTQITGFAAGGLLVAVTSPRQVLVLAAALSLGGALTAGLGLSRRPPRATGRPSVGQTWRVNAELWSMPARRHAYLAMWVPNGLVVGCEAIFIPYAPGAAGVLFVAGAAGMLAGDVLMGRFLPVRWRTRTVTPLQLLLGVPYLLFALSLPLPVAAVAVAAASFGFGGGLLLQERLIALTPAELRGQALGLHSAGLLTFQAVAASIAGAVAGWLPVGLAMAVMGALSLLATLYLAPRLRRRDQVPAPEPVPA